MNINKLDKLSYTDHHYTNHKNISILSFDGGGMRGIFSLCMLQYICEKIYGNADKSGTSLLMSNFDIICGTSTGSIIAVALSTGKSINEIKKTYYKLGEDIFSGNNYIYNPFRYIRYAQNGNFYDGDLLYNIMDKEYKNLYLANIKKYKVFVTMTDASTNEWIPYVSRSYDNVDSIIKGTSNHTVSSSIRASCAAPTYFSPIYENGKILLDGGCTSNNPSEVAIFESYHLFKDKTIKCILSFGTGLQSKESVSGNNILKVLQGIINMSTDSELIHNRVLEWTDINNIDYFRFNPPLVGDIRLDETKINTLENGEIITNNYMKTMGDNILKLKTHINDLFI
jgi:patatin-like phospholipase/acyl hydrolase